MRSDIVGGSIRKADNHWFTESEVSLIRAQIFSLWGGEMTDVHVCMHICDCLCSSRRPRLKLFVFFNGSQTCPLRQCLIFKPH